MGRVGEESQKRKSQRRKDQRESQRESEKKMQVREKVGKLRNTVLKPLKENAQRFFIRALRHSCVRCRLRGTAAAWTSAFFFNERGASSVVLGHFRFVETCEDASWCSGAVRIKSADNGRTDCGHDRSAVDFKASCDGVRRKSKSTHPCLMSKKASCSRWHAAIWEVM